MPLVAPQKDSLLPRFDLNFTGGSPRDLVDAIEKQIGKINVIIPHDLEGTHVLPLQVTQVTLPELFQALEGASRWTQPGSSRVTSYGFESRSNGDRPTAIWIFYANSQLKEEEVCRFYQLEPYLNTYTIDDITTALKTAWHMLPGAADSPEPKLSFHKETKLLIAAGSREKLAMIDQMLAQLRHPVAAPGSPIKPRNVESSGDKQ